MTLADWRGTSLSELNPAAKWFDLQLFAGEKTEKATPRRRQEARKRGQVVKSVELNSALLLLVTFSTLYLSLPYLWEGWGAFTVKAISNYTRTNLDEAFLSSLMLETTLVSAKMVLPIVGAAFVTGLVVSVLQVGFLVSGEGLKMNLGRLNPLEGFKRLFSKRAVVELFKSIWKVVAVGYIAYNAVYGNIALFPQLMDADIWTAVELVNEMIFSIAWKVGLLLLVMAVLDYFYQWWEMEQSLKMSKQEIKDEYKQMEGDPQIKAKIKERQRKMAMQRMMSQVPQADVVITNPTHFSVALSYQAKLMDAPVVVAKGQDLIALRIREIARQNGVTIVEDKPLAQALYRSVEIGDKVPPELYQAVAEVLAFVYRLKRRAF
ncbi:MAG: flagellar biosynthesis protein FlhB [Firmicutes bacterium]|nr:flagellar biosynthesis protein FlhB [Bacillota bacterium]